MNVEIFAIVFLGIMVMIYLLLPERLIIDSFSSWLSADRRAGELLRTVLTQEQYSQLIQQGYLDIASPSVPQRVYRVPQLPGLVRVIENERQQESLCLQPLGPVPDADLVVIHKLMIEADEETYLQKANRIMPLHVPG